MDLYSYWRSSASYRLRIALNLKGLAYNYCPINLLQGEQKSEAYLTINPQGLVPALELDSGAVLTQSMAILDYLEETHPNPALLPQDPLARANIRAVALYICCEIHPVNNLRVLNYLKKLGQSEETRKTWYQHWLHEGLRVVEEMYRAYPMRGTYFFGNQPTYAEICLIPQIYNALRYECDMRPYPIIHQTYQSALQTDAFTNAAPENQPDAIKA